MLMTMWYEVFDNEQVQYVTRRQVAGLMASLAVSVALSGALLVWAAAYVSLLLLLPVLAATWAVLGWAVMQWLQRMRRVMWCIKLSDRCIAGYDYARRQTRLDWTKVDRVVFAKHGLIVEADNGQSLQVSHLFPDYAAISHRVMEYAEFYELPLFVNGQPWQHLSVYHLYPFLNAAPDKTP
ncbi:MAG: hypothetical protein RhofKO_38350 [Rhodothermales bacterium]